MFAMHRLHCGQKEKMEVELCIRSAQTQTSTL